MKKIFFVLFLLCGMCLGVYAQDTGDTDTSEEEPANVSASWNTMNVLTSLLDIQTKRALKYANGEEFEGLSISPELYSFEAYGKPYLGLLLTIDDYAKIFAHTGGPTLNTIAGLNLKFLMNPSATPFIIYTAFLTLMVGFFWFKTLNDVSSGKGPSAIIPIVVPLLGKLAVGLIVAYNLPFVYGIAMKMKDIGLMVATTALNNGTAAAESIVGSSPARIANIKIRDEGVTQAIEEYLPIITYIDTAAVMTEGVSNPEETGVANLAEQVVRLNRKIESMLANVKRWGKEDGVYKRVDLTPSDIYYVGFENDKTVAENPYYRPPEGNPTAGKLSLTVALDDSEGPEYITAVWGQNPESINWLKKQFTDTFIQYIRICANTVVGTTEVDAINSFSVGSLYKGVGFLGQDIYRKADRWYIRENADDPLTRNKYIQKVKDRTASYIQEDFIDPMTNETLGEKAKNALKGAWGLLTKIFQLLVDLPKTIATTFLGVVKFFWVPFIARFGDFLFNITIEAYVYLLMLAYPFWFYKKTEKAFTGALNSLVSVSFTAATFAFLILIFEGFAGHLLNNVIGLEGLGSTGDSLASGALMGIGTAVATKNPVSLAIFVGIGVGYTIFYMIGTGICLAIAPKIFKAFLNGASVVTPMLMGSATAVAGGVLSGAMATVGTAGVAGAAGSALGGALSKSGAMTALKAKGGAIARGAGNAFRHPILTAKNAPSNIKNAIRKAPSNIKNAIAAGRDYKNASPRALDSAIGFGSVRAGLLKDFRSIPGAAQKATKAVSQRFSAIAENPKAALTSLANSPAMKIGVVAATGMSGDISKMLGAAGTMFYGGQVLSGLAQNKAKSASNSVTQEGTNTRRPRSGGGSGGGGDSHGGLSRRPSGDGSGGGSSNGGGTKNVKVDVKVKTENDVNIRKEGDVDSSTRSQSDHRKRQ